MKNLFLSLVLVMVGLVANSQVFIVTTDTIQYFQRPKEVKFVPSVEQGLIDYTSLRKGKLVYTIDVTDVNTLTLIKSGARAPSWSPDDSKLVYTELGSTNYIKTVTLVGGAVTTLGTRFGYTIHWKK